MSVYPRNLSAFLNRLSGYNKTNVKVNVLGSTAAREGDTIQIDLPTNSIVDLSSLAWVFKIVYKDPAGGHNIVPPINCEALINRLAVEVNGQTLSNIQNYNVLFHMLLYMSATEDYQRQRCLSQSNMAADATNGRAVHIAAAANAAARTRHHVIDSWLGFLGTAKPSFIDTSLLGNVRITITLAGAEVINGDHGAVVRGYDIPEQYFTMDVISIGDGIYDSMIDQRLASGAPIEVPFKNYFSFTNTNAATMAQQLNFNVASQSIDRLWATARAATHADSNVDLAATANPGHDIVVSDQPAFRFAQQGGDNWQFQINNSMYPNFQPKHPSVLFAQTKNALGEQGNMLSGCVPQSITHYQDNFFVFAQSLEHKTSDDERYMSGIDTRGAAASCHLKVDAGGAGAAAANQTLVFAECTSSLKIHANKVLEVVQ